MSIMLAKSGELPANYPLRRGVAMIELFIAIAIIGVLALVTFPLLPGWIEKTRQNEAQHMMSQIRQAELTYNTQFPGDYIDVFGGLPFEVGQQSKTFDYSVDVVAETITATRRTDGVDKYEMSIKTGKVTDLAP